MGIIDLPPTFCQIAGIDTSDWMDGQLLPTSDKEGDAQGCEYTFTQYESHTPAAPIVMNSMVAKGIVCPLYERSKTYEGTEGELTDLKDDPQRIVISWDEFSCLEVKADIIETIGKDWLAWPKAKEAQ
ncbi:MAG: hypothetical protein WA996_19295 [Candidatus Promineifilaceae bacterium]